MKNKKRVLTLLSLMAFLANGDNYAAAPLLLEISSDLSITLDAAALSVTAYMLAFGLFTLIFGPLSDRYGKVKIINIAAIGTAIFSMLGALSFNLASLVIFRAVNGAFAAGIFPVTMALAGQSSNDENRHKTLGRVMGYMFLGAATATAIGGVLSYIGSWRLVYLFYGIGELITAFVMLKLLERDQPILRKLNYVEAYKGAVTNYKLLMIVITVFFVGFSVFGTFTYSGKLLQTISDYNILIIGLILSLFGIGTVIGGRVAPVLKKILKRGFLVTAGIVGAVSLFALSLSSDIVIICLGLFGFGFAFIFFQSTLISAAQDRLPTMRGTAMSMASFNMFVGGAVGTTINSLIINVYGIPVIYRTASVMILIIGFIATILVFSKPKQTEKIR